MVAYILTSIFVAVITMLAFAIMMLVGSAVADNNYARITQCKVDLALAIDASGSIYGDETGTEENWIMIKDFLHAVVNDFEVGYHQAQVAAVQFASPNPRDTRVLWHLDAFTDKESLLYEIKSLQHPNGGKTDTEGALRLLAYDIFSPDVPGRDRPDAINVVFIVTDGMPNPYNEYTFLDVLNKVKDKAVVIGVAVGDAVDHDIMSLIDEHYIKVNDFYSLEKIVADVADRACQVVVPTEPPHPVDTCPPEPYHQYYAFTALSYGVGGNIYEYGDLLQFSHVITNAGVAYDGYSSFICPCDGYYKFSVSLSGLNFGVGVAIAKDKEIVSALAYAKEASNDVSISTETIVKCYYHQAVAVKVVVSHNTKPYWPCSIEDYALMSFSGHLLEVASDYKH